MSNKPVAILISDVHFSINNLSLAAGALAEAISTANAYKVPLIIAGDLHDTKANLRAECINRITGLLKSCLVPLYVIVGNHDLVNEKSGENALTFLSPYAEVIDAARYVKKINAVLIPYQHNKDDLLYILSKIPPNSRIIAHQGVQTAYMGEYSQDKSSVPPSAFKGHKVISGHYHRRQLIDTGDGGSFQYLGSPYTISYAESEDGLKGYSILYSDFSTELVPLNLRKHVKVERTVDTLLQPIPNLKPDDLLWLKVSGTKNQLLSINKEKVGKSHLGHSNFKLDLVPLDKNDEIVVTNHNISNHEILDTLIDKLNEIKEHKDYLKSLWRKYQGEVR